MVNFFGDDSGNVTLSWTPEPNRRGTWSILSICIITTCLCVWSAVHLNIPQHQKQASHYWRKSKWLLIGLFAPEIVAYIAWQQRLEAESLWRHLQIQYHQRNVSKWSQIVTRLFRGRVTNASTAKASVDVLPQSPMIAQSHRSELDLVHGFYALMGGFTMTSDRPEGTFLPRGLTRATVTPSGLRFLLQHEPQALPDITAEQIRDKSKADGLKKTLVCAQALWFCVQCISRLSESLPISLLELNTVGHALCALVIYLSWWDKPLDIGEPTLISETKYHPILAYMWMSSRLSAKGMVGHDVAGRLRDEFDCIWPFENPVLRDLVFEPRTPGASDPANFPDSTGQVFPSLIGPSALNQVVPSTIARENRPPVPGRHDYSFRRYLGPRYAVLHKLVRWKLLPKRSLKYDTGLGTRSTAIHHLQSSDLARWRLAHIAIEKYGLESDLRERHATNVDGRGLRSRVALRQQNMVLFTSSVQFTLALAVSGALYGGLHLVAWNAAFPSRIEQILWRTSAMCVACNGLLLGLAAYLPHCLVVRRALYRMAALRHHRYKSPLYSQDYNYKPSRFDWISNIIWIFLFGFGMIVLPLLWFSYVAARVFLVVESLKGLSYLPSGAFDTPAWPAYFPHIT